MSCQAFIACCAVDWRVVPYFALLCCALSLLFSHSLFALTSKVDAKGKTRKGNVRIEMFSTYHVALSLAVVTVLRALGLEVGGDGGLGSGHCEWGVRCEWV